MKNRQESFPIIVNNNAANEATKSYENEEIRSLLENLTAKLHTRSPLKNIEIDIVHQKNAASKTSGYRITLTVRLASGTSFVTNEESKIAKAKKVGLITAIREAFSEIERQYEKTKRR